MEEKTTNTEVRMRDVISKALSEYKDKAMRLNKDAFTRAVCDSFIESKDAKHYVVIIPVDLDDFYTPKQHKDFEKYGFSQSENPGMFNNMLLAAPSVAADMSAVLKTEEGMCADLCKDAEGNTMYVVSLNGIDSTHFNRDFMSSNERRRQPING